MIITDVLKQIAPCDRQKPYIFISYSSNDKELVWRDALEFQKHGYNIWLDEKNLDKTKASWKEDALQAIQDMYCVLMVFYVSKSSLTSESCYNELAKTIDEYTVALHMGPVKFIAIDVDEVGDIVEFSRTLYQEIFNTEGLSKEAKSKMMLTMHKFMKEFFDSNNEKVRIHPKSEPNRKMNYYEEILAAFPDETHILKPQTNLVKMLQEEAEARSKVESERKAREEAESKNAEERARLEAELKEWKEKAEKLQAEQRTPQTESEAIPAKAEKHEPEKLQKPERKVTSGTSVSADMTSKILDKLGDRAASKAVSESVEISKPKQESKIKKLTVTQIKKAIKAANQYVSHDFRTYQEVSDKNMSKVKAAIRRYAPKLKEEDVIAIMDTTVFGSGKTGFLVTVDTVYSDLFSKDCIELNRLEAYAESDKEYHMDITYDDGSVKTLFVSTPYQPDLIALLTEIIKIRKGK